jgi:transcriptional regulator with GAF, ATPase, and Fis domain
VPCLVIGDTIIPIMHKSQIASALGLSGPAVADNRHISWDIVTVASAWGQLLHRCDAEVVVEPTLSRGRTIRNLVVNSLLPLPLVADAWTTGTIPWPSPNQEALDTEKEESLSTLNDVINFAARMFQLWESFAFGKAEVLASDNPIVRSPRGDLLFSQLLLTNRRHAAFHYRQAIHHLRGRSIDTDGLVDLEVAIHDLDLPTSTY